MKRNHGSGGRKSHDNDDMCIHGSGGECRVALSGLLRINMLPDLITMMGKWHIIRFSEDKNNHYYA